MLTPCQLAIVSARRSSRWPVPCRSPTLSNRQPFRRWSAPNTRELRDLSSIGTSRHRTGRGDTDGGRMDHPQHRAIGPPLDITARRMEVRYTADWKPVELTIDATAERPGQTIRTTFDAHDGHQRDHASPARRRPRPIRSSLGRSSCRTPSSRRTRRWPSRLRTAAADSTFPVYILPQASMTLRVVDSRRPSRFKPPPGSSSRAGRASRSRARRTLPAASSMNIWGDENGRLLRLTRARAEHRRRPRRHRLGRRQAGHDFPAERRAGPDSGERLLARRHAVEAGRGRPPRRCPP